MAISQAIASFASDWYLRFALDLLALDFVLGVVAALKPPNTFRLTYISNFARNDLLKVLAWAGVYIAGKLAPSAGGIGAGSVAINLSDVAVIVWALVSAGLAGSILKNLADLKLLPAGTILTGRNPHLSSRIVD